MLIEAGDDRCTTLTSTLTPIYDNGDSNDGDGDDDDDDCDGNDDILSPIYGDDVYLNKLHQKVSPNFQVFIKTCP
jgi:hypothetical protein